MSSSPDRHPDERVLRGDDARELVAADFGVDLRSTTPRPSAATVRAGEAARTAGYADGWAQGQRAAKVAAQARADQVAAAERAAAQARAEVAQRALAALGRAAADLDARRTPAVAEITDTILASAVEIAEAIIGYEVSHAPDGPLAAVRRAMAAVPDGGPVTVRLHPEDYASIVGQGSAGLHTDRPGGGAGAGSPLVAPGGAPRVPAVGESTYSFNGRPITVRADAALAPGDAVAEYGETTVDATLSAAVARVREVLGR